jgi:NAD(P)-dependent dehydrogenase (short-subunit alcohol dehydrogenase family)
LNAPSRKWFDLSGQAALITGGSRGLGKAIGSALAGAGAAVGLVSRNLEQARAAAREVAAATGSRAVGLAADVARPDEVSRMVGDALEQLGRIDILVNNAGAGLTGSTVDFSDDDWLTVLQTNLSGAFYCCRAVAPHMIERRSGRIINVASILAAVAMPGFAAYCTSKAGLVGLTKALALEWASHGIAVNALCPGFFPTEMTQHIHDDPQAHALIAGRIPVGRWGQDAEVGAAALYLASPQAAFTTGSCLFVDGGWVAQ